jgi:BON domain-containing protein
VSKDAHKVIISEKKYILRGILPALMISVIALSSPLLAREIEDREIEQAINDELSSDPFVESNDLVVIVENGVANLTGTVESWTEYAAAIADAFQAGAKDILNNLEVRSDTTPQNGKNKKLQ